MVAMGVIVFLPLLAVLAATKDREDELARLKGEHTAVYETIAGKQCDRQPALLEASGPAKTETATVGAAPVTSAAATPIGTPAKAETLTNPDEVIVCQEATVVLSRTRAACESAGGKVI